MLVYIKANHYNLFGIETLIFMIVLDTFLNMTVLPHCGPTWRRHRVGYAAHQDRQIARSGKLFKAVTNLSHFNELANNING